jgi:hypothetical protein
MGAFALRRVRLEARSPAELPAGWMGLMFVNMQENE